MRESAEPINKGLTPFLLELDGWVVPHLTGKLLMKLWSHLRARESTEIATDLFYKMGSEDETA